MAFEDSDVYQAILDGDLAALGCSVGAQDINLRDSSGKSYLHICIELGQKELVEYLAHKVFLGFRDDKGLTVLDLAARYRMTEVEHHLIQRVAGMQDSDDTEALLQLFQSGWRAWPPIEHNTEDGEDTQLPPGYQCQQDILRLQVEVDMVHQAVYQGKLPQLQTAESRDLMVVCDHTGLPPLQKAVLFEWLSLVQYISHAFPHTVNHPDHMGRTALHYAAAYHEYQDNILYKQLLKAGASEDVSDLNGFKPNDFLKDASLFSIDHMQEEINSRLSRPPKDYSSHLSFSDIRNCPPVLQPDETSHTHNLKRWRILASVAKFGNSSHRKTSRNVPFEETRLYESIITNDVYGVRHWLSKGEEINQHSVEGWSYLHLAVAYNVSPGLLSLLLTHLSPAHRDSDGLTPLDLCLITYKNPNLTRVFLDVITGRILAGDVPALQALAQQGWPYWPNEEYVDSYLQPHLTPQMSHFLTSVMPFLSDVREVHQAAMLHQEVCCGLSYTLDTQAAVTCLNSAGLPLVHVCVIFYNIKLLSHLLKAFPFTANLKDSVGRTPLHYAACLTDEGYMFTLLRSAKARDDEEDMFGMRPGDYSMERREIVSPTIQELIRDKVHHPLVLQPPWPTCLLSAQMESSKVTEAIKANDLNTLHDLLADPGTYLSQHDGQGQGFLHQALLTGADIPIFSALLDKVDIALRDFNGNTIMELIVPGFYPENIQEAVESRVRDLILDVENGEEEAQRLLLTGWSHWPVSIRHDARAKSTQSVQMLHRLFQLKREVAAVHRAVYQGQTDDLSPLLHHPALATAADHTGLPPLHKAVLLNHQHMVHYFISNLPSALHVRDHMGRTALHYAAALTHSDKGQLYRTLEEAGADPAATDLMGYTPQDFQQQPHTLHVADIVKGIKDLLDTLVTNFKKQEIAETASSTFGGLDNLSNPESSTAVQEQPSSRYTPSSDRAPSPATVDGRYITQHLGQALTLALAEIVQKQPSDPIEYLGQWLYRYGKIANNTDQVKIKSVKH